MSLFAQQLVVVVVIAIAALFSVWRLLGAAMHLRLLAWLLHRVSATGAPGIWLRRKLLARQVALQSDGCGRCSSNRGAAGRRR